MTTREKLELIADILDVEADTLTPETKISSLEWDSIATLSFIAMLDENFGKVVKGAVIKNFVTLQDALNIMEG